MPPNRGPTRATLEPSSPLRAGKIMIYVNSNLHNYIIFHLTDTISFHSHSGTFPAKI